MYPSLNLHWFCVNWAELRHEGGCECKADGIIGTRGKQETLPIGKTQRFFKKMVKADSNEEELKGGETLECGVHETKEWDE